MIFIGYAFAFIAIIGFGFLTLSKSMDTAHALSTALDSSTNSSIILTKRPPAPAGGVSQKACLSHSTYGTLPAQDKGRKQQGALTAHRGFAQYLIPFLILLLCVCSSPKNEHQAAPGNYKRIISFAPSITETLFAIGLGDRVVGVTRFCNYPPQVKNIPKIGGYVDPNYEMIFSLKPDLVLLLKEHVDLISFLQKNNIQYQLIDNESFSSILLSFHFIGDLCKKTVLADSIITSIKQEMDTTQTPGKRPRILFCIGRDNPGSGSVSKIFVAGPKSFYSQLINYAGAENAYTDSTYAYPSFSSEGIIKLNPDIIIDIMATVVNADSKVVKHDWESLPMLPAVKNNLVFCPNNDYMTIPGPRIGDILKKIKETVKEFKAKEKQE